MAVVGATAALEEEDPLGWEDRRPSVPFWRHAFAGSCAGIAEHVGMYPFDTVKTRMQALPSAGASSQGFLQTIGSITQERGVGGLFRGVSVIGAGCVPAHCGLFLTYELSKESLLRDSSGHQPLLTAICGGAAATVHDMVLTPSDVVKQRLQLGRYDGVVHCVRTILHVEGMGALYRSLPVTLLSNVPNTAVLAAVNESMKLILGVSGTGDTQSPSARLPWLFLCGGIGGAVAAAVTVPLDVVKTHLQTQGVAKGSGGLCGGGFRGIATAVRSLWQQDGPRAFFRGVVPRIIAATPAAAICWGTYESIQSVCSHVLDDAADEEDPAQVARQAAMKAVDVAAHLAGAAGVGLDDDEDDDLEWEHWTPQKGSWWKHMVAGSAAGVAEHVALYPVDTVKTQMQAAPAVPGAAPATARQITQSILSQQGLRGLFRGCLVSAGGSIPAHIGLFTTYEATKALLLKSGAEKRHEPLRAACCGIFSTFVHDSVMVPMDVVKQRLQLGRYNGALHCVLQILRTEGPFAFYKSLPATLIMECPYYGILVAVNESLKLSFRLEGSEHRESASLRHALHFATAGLSGIVACACTQPLDVVKTRLQTQDSLQAMAGEAEGAQGKPVQDVRYNGLVSTARLVVQEEGVRGLYRGTVPRMIFAAPSAALCWGTYEAVKMLLG